ncbi:MAG TPA: STAS domain-containing protein [Acidimicrobiales bacterium]|nr:STAS domain-containing protein [Acidimicrobiales bacterium]
MTTCDIDAAHDGTDVVLRLAGEIDLANHDHVAEEVKAAITNETTSVRVDLDGITYLDSTGLRFLFALAERLDRMQVDLAIVAPPASIARKVVDVAGLGHVASIQDA